MDSFEFNKIAGAALMALLITTVIGHAGDILVPEPVEGKSHLQIAGAETTAAPAQKAVAAAPQPIGPFLAKANVEAGKKEAKICQTCHTLGKGEPARVGPNLWGIIGAKRAHMAGFSYSAAITNLGGTWNADELNQFLTKPSAYAPGTKMTFAGISDEQKRADVIAYLNTLSDSPQPLPTK